MGNIPVDREVTDHLSEAGGIKLMSTKVDEEEHSFELHMPFIYKMSTANGTRPPTPVVPIMVGDTDATFDNKLASLLAPYFADKSNAFVVSTDFCHWGLRFGYTAYTDSKAVVDIRNLGRISKTAPGVPIFRSIEYLDRLGMKVASLGSYTKWTEYLDRTDNTICGRTPLGIVLRTIEKVDEQDRNEDYGFLKWIGYAQSSRVTDISDSSVSYASGYAVC
ncbi:Mho1p [Sugiyamaella lignohabitans]|uniref:Mho1p n=1 Tax=Sugiyamaella lignohabitans TaxID=796027 RepID=A0A167FLI1_9ASCO|nr:Mho1p [Sugiyamaella lignohabitans]ANB15452.1 Mho1p [Sugiyamaella lignohabitans]